MPQVDIINISRDINFPNMWVFMNSVQHYNYVETFITQWINDASPSMIILIQKRYKSKYFNVTTKMYVLNNIKSKFATRERK